MLNLSEIVNNTRGTLRLLRFDPAGAAYFDNTLEAFWRSFRVLFLVAPAYAVIRIIDYSSYNIAASDLEVVLFETLNYVVQWFLYPVAMLEIARLSNLQGNYLRYISALNWMSVPLIAIALAVVALYHLLPVFRATFSIGLQLLIFVWFYSATRLTLGAGWLMTLGLYVFNTATTLLFDIFIQRTLGIEPI